MFWRTKGFRFTAMTAMAAFAVSATPAANCGTSDTVLPTVFESGHFYAVPQLSNGKSLRMMLDTGGGTVPTYFINQSQADLLGIKPDRTCQMDGQTFKVATPAYIDGHAMPDISSLCHGLVIAPDSEDKTPFGQLVPMYFLEGVWTFDYPKQQVILRGSSWRPAKNAHTTPLGFKRIDGGAYAGWPRIAVRIDGENLNMLLDTGATAKPTAEVLKEDPRSTTDGITVGSYITHSMMARWIKRHADWKVIDKGDAYFLKPTRMIRVPNVEIAGWNVGPVWFIERRDEAFHSMMASLMDQPPEGAIGANVYEHFRMTIDYKRKAAWFECVSGCSTARAAKTSHGADVGKS